MTITTKDQDRKNVENVLTNKSVVLNEGVFLLRINKTDVDQADFVKQCLFADAFPSAYSQHVSMIPTGIFLPQLVSGKNVFLEHKVGNAKTPLIDSFTNFAFLIHKKGHRDIKQMYDKLLIRKENQTYSDVYSKLLSSYRCHSQNNKPNLLSGFETELLSDSDEEDSETEQHLQENQDTYTVVFFTQAASVRIQLDEKTRLTFGSDGSDHYVSIDSNVIAKFDGYTTSQRFSIRLSESVTMAIKRELLTMTQLFVGYSKRPEQDMRTYLQNVNCLFGNQIKSVICPDPENVESYSVSALKIWLSRNLEVDEINRSWPVLNDTDYENTVKENILFRLLMILDKGSCFNSRQLCRRELTEGKPSIVCTSTYSNPFSELKQAVYNNASMMLHLLTECLFFAQVKERFTCETCHQTICAVAIPSLMFKHSPKITSKKERVAAVLSFHTSSLYNKTGPVGDLTDDDSKNADSFNPNNKIDWEKHHRDLLSFLTDSANFNPKCIVDSETPTTADNIEDRASKVIEWISDQIDNVVQLSEQFCNELDDGAESVVKTTNVEATIKNIYSVLNYYNFGFTGVLLSESLIYLLRCLVLYEQHSFENHSVSDVFLKVRLLLLDNKSGFSVRNLQNVKNITLPKLAVKSYIVDDIQVDIDSKLTENYQLDEIIYKASFKCKAYLFGRYDEKKENGGKSNQTMLHYMSSKRSSMQMASANVGNNSFNHFKGFVSQQACEALDILGDDYCRQILNEYRDEKLWEYAHLFKYVKEYKIEDWSSFVYLVSVMKLLEHLKIQPSFDKISFLTFHRLDKNKNGAFSFNSDKIGNEFDKTETVYSMNCCMTEYSGDKQNAVFKKCQGRFLGQQNDLLNTFSRVKMYPGVSIYYMPIREKNSKFQGNANSDFLTNFINQEQYTQEKDASYTTYIVKHRKQFFDGVFEATFSEQGKCIENRYESEVLNEMLETFDEKFPVFMFVNEQVHSFLRLVISEYLNPDQSVVQVMAKRIKEINIRVRNRVTQKRKRDGENDETVEINQNHYVQNINENDEDDDAENQFLSKRTKLE